MTDRCKNINFPTSYAMRSVMRDPLLIIQTKSMQLQWGSIMRNMYNAAILVPNNGFHISKSYIFLPFPILSIWNHCTTAEADCDDFWVTPAMSARFHVWFNVWSISSLSLFRCYSLFTSRRWKIWGAIHTDLDLRIWHHCSSLVTVIEALRGFRKLFFWLKIENKVVSLIY